MSAVTNPLPASSTAATFEHSNAKEQLLSGANGAVANKLSAAPLQFIPLPSPHQLALPADGFCPLPLRNVEVPKVVREYPLPGAVQTHEMAMVGDNMLVITQQTNSYLVKVQLSPSTGRPIACARFLLGNFWDGLHGLYASQAYKGHVWATLQFKSLLIRIDVGENLAAAPVVVEVIPLPASVNGPHCVYENGNNLWTSCKDSGHVVRINYANQADYNVYPCSRRPIFIAVHPTSKDVYASLDLSSKIWRLEASTGNTTEIDIPAAKGNTPGGLVHGPDGNVWFVLVGDTSGGTGTFARILKTGECQWFALTTSIGTKAGLIHLAFDYDYHRKQQARDSNSSLYLGLWLLASSMVAEEGNGIDAVFTVVIDSDLGRITNQHSIVLPTQLSATHRVLPHRTGLFVTELKVSALAHISGTAALKPTDVVSETSDFYADYGLGQSLSYYMFSEELMSRGAVLGASTVRRSASTITSQQGGGKRPRATPSTS